GFSDDPMALAYARARLTIAFRMGGLPGAIDGPSAADADDAGVRRDAEATHMMGMTGTLVLTVDQVNALNDAMSPSEDERHWARHAGQDRQARAHGRPGERPQRRRVAERGGAPLGPSDARGRRRRCRDHRRLLPAPSGPREEDRFPGRHLRTLERLRHHG